LRFKIVVRSIKILAQMLNPYNGKYLKIGRMSMMLAIDLASNPKGQIIVIEALLNTQSVNFAFGGIQTGFTRDWTSN
jgi:hypothetical protein